MGMQSTVRPRGDRTVRVAEILVANCRRWELSYRDAPEYAEDGMRNGFFGNMPPWLELPPRHQPDLSEDRPMYEN